MMESTHVGARRNILYIYLIKHATRYQDPGGFVFSISTSDKNSIVIFIVVVTYCQFHITNENKRL